MDLGTPKRRSRKSEHADDELRNISAVQNDVRGKMRNPRVSLGYNKDNTAGPGRVSLGYNKDNIAGAAYRKRHA